MKFKMFFSYLVICALPAWLMPMCFSLAWQPNRVVSHLGFFTFNLIFMMGVYIALAGILFLFSLPILLILVKPRRDLLRYGCLAIVGIMAFGGGELLRHRIVRHGVAKIQVNAQPLIRAIEKYELQHGSPPMRLDDLKPNYVTSIPNTGVGCFPDFNYFVNQPENYDNNPWVLTATPPSVIMGFDQVLYFPLQNYPQRGYGGSLELMDLWAYVHE